jgi:hydrogenase nickel incorporation protein HypA/HybF
MHELSIAQNIIETVQSNVPKSDWEHIAAVRLKIGTGAGVVADSLEFSFDAVKADSKINNAYLEIESIPFRIHCNVCDVDMDAENGMALCEKCGSADTKIISGTELIISEIEITESDTVKS